MFILMPKHTDRRKCCCSVVGSRRGTKPRRCCKREYRCIVQGLDQLDKRLIKLIELQVSKLNVVDRPEFPVYLRFESLGYRILILRCYWVSATRFAIAGIEYKSFNANGIYMTLIKLIDGDQGLELPHCRHDRFESADVAFNYLCKQVRIEMNKHEILNTVQSLDQLLDDAESCGSKRRKPPTSLQAA